MALLVNSFAIALSFALGQLALQWTLNGKGGKSQMAVVPASGFALVGALIPFWLVYRVTGYLPMGKRVDLS